MGFDGNVLYRIVTDPFSLEAHPREDTIVSSSSGPLLPSCFLGVNLTVQPREPAIPANRRKANLSETSTQSAESDDVEAPGFEFFQLGRLGYAQNPNDQEGWPKDDGTKYGWRETGFVVVAKLGAFGYVDGISAIYDMFMTDEYDDGNDPDSKKLITHPCWGIRPTASATGHDDQFSCARLGPSHSSFGKHHRVVWTEKIEHPVELARVKSLGDGPSRILRATVDKNWLSAVRGSES